MQPIPSTIPELAPEGPVMDLPWDDFYVQSSASGELWCLVHSSPPMWPQGVQLHRGRMYQEGRLCVPEGVALKVLWEFHSAAVHVGNTRMLKEVHLRFVISDQVPVQTWVQGIRKGFRACQEVEPPTLPRRECRSPFQFRKGSCILCVWNFFLQCHPPTGWRWTMTAF